MRRSIIFLRLHILLIALLVLALLQVSAGTVFALRCRTIYYSPATYACYDADVCNSSCELGTYNCCSGARFDCSRQECCNDTNWSDISGCSVSCGPGTKNQRNGCGDTRSVGCNNGPCPTPTPRPTSTPTPTPTPTLTPTPMPTNTPIPTSTPTPMPTLTPSPTSTPSPTPTPAQQWFQVVGGGGGVTVNRTGGTSINVNLPAGKYFFDPGSIGGIIIAAASTSFGLNQTHPQPSQRHLVTNYGPITSSYNYTYFKNKYAARDSLPDSSAGPTLPTNLTGKSYYYYSNPLGALTVGAGTYSGTAVIIVEGDLSITGNVNFAANSALAFFVKGRSGGGITVNGNVTSVRGFFLTDGRFDSGASSSQFTLTGGVVADSFLLRRSL